MIEALKKIHAVFELRWKKLGKPPGIAELIKWDLERHINFDSNAPAPKHTPRATLLEATNFLEDWGNTELCRKWGLDSYETTPAEIDAIKNVRAVLSERG